MEIVAWFEVINTALHNPPPPLIILFFFPLHVHCISLRANYDLFFSVLIWLSRKGKGNAGTGSKLQRIKIKW